MSSDLFTLASLGSSAGLVAATFMLVGFFKDPVRKYLGDWFVRLLAVIIAFVIQFFVLYVGSGITVAAGGLALLNSFMVAITAAGAHELTKPRPQEAPNSPRPPTAEVTE